MKTITRNLTDIVSAAFEKCGYDAALGRVTVSDRPELCQFQCNGAFAAAKQYRKPPFVVAQEVADVLTQDATFAKAEVVKPGFLNLTLADEALLKLVVELSEDEHGGIPQAEKPETIIIDYGGPNVAKSLHVGHLRSAIIGESLKRLARAFGHKAIGDVHLGDWGLQIGLVIAELTVRHPDWRVWALDFDKAVDPVPELTPDLLCEVYPFASQKSKTDEAFAEAAHIATAELQSRRPGYIALWEEIMRVAVADLKANYAKLDVDFDCWYGESDADAYIPQLMQTLEEQGLSYESNGALVVDVAEETDKAPMPPIIVRKSDNSYIYGTTDLATIIQRQQDFDPDRMWYVVDKRQHLHLTQVFRCAKRAGLVRPECEIYHLGFGTMNGSDGKPYKTRDGGVMRLEDLIATVTNTSLERLAQSSFVEEGDREDYARKLGMAAIKFGDLINHPTKDYIFDLDKFLSAEGKTGIYLLYSISRINSMLKKAGDQPRSFNGVYSESERDLMLRLVESGDAFVGAFNELAPNYVCENAYQLAVAFSRFYHDNRILDEQDDAKRANWLALCELVRDQLCRHLNILGITPVENM